VYAKLCRVPWRWRWSSAAAHAAGRDDVVIRAGPLLERVRDWREFLLQAMEADEADLMRSHERTGRPLGESGFLDRIEETLGRSVRPVKPCRKPKRQEKQVWCPRNSDTCVYAYWDIGLWGRTLWSGFPCGPICANHPDTPGRMRETPAGGVCRNYRAKPPEPKPDLARIPLGDGRYVYVDPADFEWLSRWKWHVMGDYAARYEKGKVVLMHRQILPPPKGMIVDHVNRNKLDNSRANLRICTHRENTRNRAKPIGCASRFKGVCREKKTGKWKAAVRSGPEPVYLGTFDDEVEAARAYDRRAVEVFGEFARLNFPDEWPPERRDAVRREVEKAGRSEGQKVKTRKTPARAETPGRGELKRKTHGQPQRAQRTRRCELPER
jgi:hypothetical protein